MLELTCEQQQLVAKSAGSLATLIDPDTKAAYVLVPMSVYQRLVRALGDDFSPTDAYPAVDRSFAEAWNDPKMDDYDRYEELKQ